MKADNNIYLAQIDGTGEMQLTVSGNIPMDSVLGSSLSWSEDRTELFYKSEAGIEKVNVQTKVQEIVIPDPMALSPDVSPNGAEILYLKPDGLYVANTNGSNEKKLADAHTEGRAVFSPNGEMIVYTGSGTEVFIMNKDGTGQKDLTGAMSTADDHNHNIYPMWSPDGNKIAFHSDDMTNSSTSGDIWTVELNRSAGGGSIPSGYHVSLQVGANEGDTFEVELSDARAKALGINELSVESETGAQEAIILLNTALERVSAERSKYGAYQNALEYIHTNVTNSGENATASESRISDADMALEMTEFTKRNILVQSGQAMLAQSNQLPQGILQFLK